jgi:hypothetical protein
MRRLCAALAISGLALLAACGQSTGDRALSGGALGAAGGAAIGGITGGSVLGGAVLGGAVGAAAGALTSPGDVNLGRPAWR